MDALRSLAYGRRVLGLVVVGGLLALALATYQIAPGLPSSFEPATAGEQRRPTAPTTARSTTIAPTATDLPPGPGTTDPGIFLVATPDGDEGFSVIEMVRFDKPVTMVTLRAPQVTEQWGAGFVDAVPRVVQVQASADNVPVTVPSGELDRLQTLPISPAAQTVVLRYRLAGTVVRTRPSTAGRALGAVRPLIAGVPDDLPVTVEVSGDGVRNLTCPTRPSAEQMCASGRPPRLQTSGELPWSQCLVIVQLDLPMPR